MQIFGPFRVSTTAPVGGTQRPPAGKPTEPTAAPRTSSPIDQLDISSSVNRLDSTAAASGSDIRVDRVAELRRQISSGNYETPEKLDVTLNRFLDEFA